MTAVPAELERRAELPVPLLRQPLYRRFWAGRTISIFGDQVSALAIPLTAILVLHASAFEVGLLTSMAWLPDLLLALPAGVWIDARPHRRAVMIAADLLRAAVLVTIPVAWWLGALTVWQLLLVTFVAGSLKVFFDLASISFTIAIVLGAGALGGLVGALIGARVGRLIGMGRAVVLGAIFFPSMLVLFPLAHGPHLLAAGMLLAGEFLASIGVMIFDINQNTILAYHVPEQVRSRVFGAYRFLNYGTRPIGALLGGILGSAIGLRETMWIAVVGGMLGVLFLVHSPLAGVRDAA